MFNTSDEYGTRKTHCARGSCSRQQNEIITQVAFLAYVHHHGTLLSKMARGEIPTDTISLKYPRFACHLVVCPACFILSNPICPGRSFVDADLCICASNSGGVSIHEVCNPTSKVRCTGGFNSIGKLALPLSSFCHALQFGNPRSHLSHPGRVGGVITAFLESGANLNLFPNL